jgi:adenylate cyclase
MEHPDLDFEAEGLFDDVEGAQAREARARLINYLIDEEGVEFEEIKLAHAEKRLFLLPVERALGGAPIYTAAEVAEKAGVDLELFLELRSALGLADPGPDIKNYSEYDVKTMRAVRWNMELGMSIDSVREINRVLGAAMSQLALTVERRFLTTFLDPSEDEDEMARRYAELTRLVTPEFAFVLQHIFNLHMRDSIRSDILGNEAVIDLLNDTRELAVAFADLVGFTSLGEEVPADELGEIAQRLNTLTVEAVEAPVRLVKTIGDAVMLVSPDPRALLDTVLGLVDTVENLEDEFPRLSVGVDFGEALDRSGDVFGPPVNLASRLSDVARAGAVLVTSSVREKLEDDYDWTSVGRRRFKGIEKPVSVHRARVLGTREARRQI